MQSKGRAAFLSQLVAAALSSDAVGSTSSCSSSSKQSSARTLVRPGDGAEVKLAVGCPSIRNEPDALVERASIVACRCLRTSSNAAASTSDSTTSSSSVANSAASTEGKVSTSASSPAPASAAAAHAQSRACVCGLLERNDGVAAVVDVLQRFDRVEYFGCGALTNLSRALERQPQLAAKVTLVQMVGKNSLISATQFSLQSVVRARRFTKHGCAHVAVQGPLVVKLFPYPAKGAQYNARIDPKSFFHVFSALSSGGSGSGTGKEETKKNVDAVSATQDAHRQQQSQQQEQPCRLFLLPSHVSHTHFPAVPAAAAAPSSSSSAAASACAPPLSAAPRSAVGFYADDPLFSALKHSKHPLHR